MFREDLIVGSRDLGFLMVEDGNVRKRQKIVLCKQFKCEFRLNYIPVN